MSSNPFKVHLLSSEEIADLESVVPDETPGEINIEDHSDELEEVEAPDDVTEENYLDFLPDYTKITPTINTLSFTNDGLLADDNVEDETKPEPQAAYLESEAHA